MITFLSTLLVLMLIGSPVVTSSYSYTWTPTTAGNYNFTIYMVSNIETWSSVSGIVTVLAASHSGFPASILLIIFGASVGVVIVLVVIMKIRGKKKKYDDLSTIGLSLFPKESTCASLYNVRSV